MVTGTRYFHLLIGLVDSRLQVRFPFVGSLNFSYIFFGSVNSQSGHLILQQIITLRVMDLDEMWEKV